MSKSITLSAAPVSVQDSQDQDDLHIVKYLNQDKLPELLRLMLSMASTPQEQDILLIASLAAMSACMPNLYFRYGDTGKRYYANLQCFIMAASASGKGIAGQALDMIRVIDEQHPLLIAGDSTLPAWYKALEEQGGCGYMHESEGSVITDIWRNAAANYNTALRKAAEHEPISRNRCKGSSEIRSPRLSMLLTGTFGQYRHLVPGVENGYFSRLLTLVERDARPFDKRYVTASGTKSAISQQVGWQMLRLYEQLQAADEQEWSLTETQKERLGEHLATEYSTLIDLLGDNFHSVVVRMAIHVERIAMVLSAIRRANDQPNMADKSTGLVTDAREDGGFNPPVMDEEKWLCADEDYATAEMIGNKLLLHMAMAYRMIEGDKQELVPDIKPLDQRRVLFEQLPDEYENKVLFSEAISQGISTRTATRWNENWQEQGLVLKIKHGVYKKVG